MTRMYTWVAGAVLGLSVVGPAYAAPPLNPIYFGIKAGTMDADADGFKDASNLGLFAGYTFTQDATGELSAEGEYTRTFDKGDVRAGPVRGDWDVESLAGYLAYRTAGSVYVKAKGGYLWRDISVDGLGRGIEGSDTGFSYGAGVGGRFSNKAGIEIEYTVIDDDISFLSLGYFTHF